MSTHSIQCHCPQCGQNAKHAFVPLALQSGTSDLPATGNAGLTADQRFVCSACEQVWEAAIVPTAQLERLRAAVTGLDEAKRQIAMLRLIMSKDQIERAEQSREGVLRIHRAA